METYHIKTDDRDGEKIDDSIVIRMVAECVSAHIIESHSLDESCEITVNEREENMIDVEVKEDV